MYLLERARRARCRARRGPVRDDRTTGDACAACTSPGRGAGACIGTERAVSPPGPFFHRAVACSASRCRSSALHAKIAWKDARRRDAARRAASPSGPIRCASRGRPRSARARGIGAHDPLLGELPCGRARSAEGAGDQRPSWESGPMTRPRNQRFPLALTPAYPEVVLRGMARMISRADALSRAPRAASWTGLLHQTR